jgi:hypothetical protein
VAVYLTEDRAVVQGRAIPNLQGCYRLVIGVLWDITRVSQGCYSGVDRDTTGVLQRCRQGYHKG